MVLVVTAGVIVVGNLIAGVVVGLALAVGKVAWDISHVHVEVEVGEQGDGGDCGDGVVVVRVVGHATFLRLPKLLDALEALPRGREVRLELGGLRHVDHACAAALEGWVAGRGMGRGMGMDQGAGAGGGAGSGSGG